MKYLKDEIIVPLYSKEIFDEYKNVLNREEFNLPNHVVGRILNLIKQFGVCIAPIRTKEKLLDINDQIFYDVTMAKRDSNSYLITGNLKHFPVRSFIVSPKDMINIINRSKKYA